MIYVNLCVQYICPLNKFYILLQNQVCNIYARNFYCSVNTIAFQVSALLRKIKKHGQKYNFIFANKIHFWILWMEYTSSSKEHTISWNNKIVNYVYDNNILLKLSEEWIGKFRSYTACLKKNFLPTIKIASKYFCETCCKIYRQKLILSVFWKLPT